MENPVDRRRALTTLGGAGLGALLAATTIYPGRITHIHFQVFLNNGLVATSQLAFPQEITKAVYDTADYAAHGQNTTVTDFSQDGVFSDGTTGEMLALKKDSSAGYHATLTVGIAA
jgi:hypothetical protein